MAEELVRIPPAPHLAASHQGSGEGVVFLHGIGGNRRNWISQLPAFAEHFHAIAYDARGYGDSDDYDGRLAFADYADDLVRVLDFFELETAHIVGLSMGGRVAIDFANRYAGRVKTLTLCDTHLGMIEMSREKRQHFLDLRREPLLSGLEPKDIAHPVATSLSGPDISPDAFAQLIDSLGRLHKESYLKSIEASVMDDTLSGVGTITAPTHVVVGSEDSLTPPDIAREIVAAIPGATLTIFEGAGHLSNIEQPGAFNADVLSFIQRQVSG